MDHRKQLGHVTRAPLGTALVLAALTASASAQWPTAVSGWGASVVMEPVIAAYGGFNALCNPSAARRSGWGADQIAKLINPTAAQRTLLEDLRAATAKATELPDAACPRQIPRDSRDRMLFLERRLAALLEAAKTIVPAFETFHGSLTDEQKAQL